MLSEMPMSAIMEGGSSVALSDKSQSEEEKEWSEFRCSQESPPRPDIE
jgi:hypothetical protein